MKKIAKISLVAAVAVAGLTTANAQPLEQAIKGVEVSGSVVYRYNDYNNDTSKDSLVGGDGRNAAGERVDPNTVSKSSNNYKVGTNVAAPVNDFVKINTRFLVANNAGEFAGADGTAGGLDTQADGDSNVDVELSNAYFGFTGIKNTTVNAGKQGLTTPWTVATQIDGNEQTGTGLLALSTLGNVTLAAAYFNQTNLGTSGNLEGNNSIVGSRDIATAGTIVALGPVTADAWVADMQGIFQTYTLGAKTSTTLGGLKLGADARFTELELKRDYVETALATKLGLNTSDLSVYNDTNNVKDDNSLAKLTITADYDIFNSKAVYGKTGKEGGLTALDNDASTTALGWSVNANGKADADFYHLQAGVNILPELNLSGNYVNVDYTRSSTTNLDMDNKIINSDKTSVEEEEFYAQLTYKMSKNLTSYVRYGVYTKDASSHVDGRTNVDHKNSNAKTKDYISSRNDEVDETRGRIQVAYTF